MKITIKKILIGILLVTGLFVAYLYLFFLPAEPLTGENIKNLIDFRNSQGLTNVRAVYLIVSEKYGSGKVKFFIGPKPILRRLSRQDSFVGKDDGWVLRWLRGEYPVSGFQWKQAIENDDLLNRLSNFEIEEGAGFSGKSIHSVLCYIVEKDGDLYEYALCLVEKDGMYLGSDWQSRELKQIFQEIEQKYHLKFMDSI